MYKQVVLISLKFLSDSHFVFPIPITMVVIYFYLSYNCPIVCQKSKCSDLILEVEHYFSRSRNAVKSSLWQKYGKHNSLLPINYIIHSILGLAIMSCRNLSVQNADMKLFFIRLFTDVGKLVILLM